MTLVHGRLLLLPLALASACKSPPQGGVGAVASSAAPAAPSAEGVRIRVAGPSWSRAMRYFALPHVYADRERAKITLEVGAEYDGACIYAIEDSGHEGIPAAVRAMAKRSRTATSVVVHVSNAVDAITIERVLRAAKTTGLDVFFSSAYRPPGQKSPPDCVPASAEFDGPNMFDPFVRSWAILGACSARCAPDVESEEACTRDCVLAEEKKPLHGR